MNTERKKNAAKIGIGDRVVHRKYGAGTVKRITRDKDEETIYQIEFDSNEKEGCWFTSKNLLSKNDVGQTDKTVDQDKYRKKFLGSVPLKQLQTFSDKALSGENILLEIYSVVSEPYDPTANTVSDKPTKNKETEVKNKADDNRIMYDSGNRIRHLIFGCGTILETIPLNNKTVYKIEFANGKERLCRSFFLKKL